jgi:hypothetical protein
MGASRTEALRLDPRFDEKQKVQRDAVEHRSVAASPPPRPEVPWPITWCHACFSQGF